MSTPITPIRNIALPDRAGIERDAAAPGGFQSVLEKAVGTVEKTRSDASASIEQFLNGEGEELHSVVMSTERAELAFDLFLQTRNKVVQAYQEIMRMQM